MSILIESQYLPSIQYCSKFCTNQPIIIEQHENYRKGTYRNRAHVATANGFLRLTIPLQKGKNQQQNIRTTRIAYDQDWQTQHLMTIQAAYGNSPFFDYYIDELRPFFEEQYEFLFDWNQAVLNQLLELMGIVPNYTLSTEFKKEVSSDCLDLRNFIQPKLSKQQVDPNYKSIKYGQVFEERYGFLPNLSVLDLLFCTGPEASSVLQRSSLS